MIRVLNSVSNMDRAGIETMIMNYYRHLDRDKVQFDFWANKPNPGAYEEEIAALGGRVYRSPGYSPARFPAYVRMMKKLLRENPDIKIIHVHNGALGLYALVAAKLCGVKARVYHAHSTRVPPGSTKALKIIFKPLIPFAATKLFACGDASARFYYGNRRVNAGKCVYIPNAIEPRHFAYDASTRRNMRSEHGLDGHTVIGHVGRMTAAKNHIRMLDIFKAFLRREPDALLVLLGDGELEKSVRAHAESIGISSSVRFMGNVDNVAQWYQAMDVFFMPSIFEGLPVVAIEAQAAGLNCILSDAITSEVGVTKLVRFLSLSQTDDEWAKALQTAARDGVERPDTMNDIRASGFDITTEAPKLQALYEAYGEGGQ